jgi:hypothetical protein
VPTKLSLNWLAYHRDDNDWHILSRWQPPSVKVFNDNWSDPFFVEKVFDVLPNSLITFRDVPLSEQKDAMRSDPVGTGRRHAEHWINVVNTRLSSIKTFDPQRALFLGINEPGVAVNEYTTDGKYIEPLPRPNPADVVTRYTVSFLDTLKAAGLRGGALNLSVGWPDNHGKDTPADWSYFEPVREAIVRGNHVLFVHCYWSPAGPQHNFGWWAGRLGQCPWNVPIIVGECGIDHGVVDGNLQGWQAYVSKEQYLAQLFDYDHLMRRDPRVHSLQIFSYDFTDRWWSFDVRPLQQELAAYAESERGKVDAHIAFPYYPPTVVIPPLEPEPDMLARSLQAAFGDKFHDERVRDFPAIDSRQMRYIVIHHSATPRETTTKAIRDYHVKSNGWSGTGYHFIIRLGHVHYVGDVDTQRAHVLNRNDEALGICITGTYATTAPAVEDVDALKRLIKVLDSYYGVGKALRGHRDLMAPGYTSCPGDALAGLIGALRALPVPVPAPEPPPLRWDKIAWGVEAIARLLQTEGWTAEHDHLLKSAVYQEAVAKR